MPEDQKHAAPTVPKNVMKVAWDIVNLTGQSNADGTPERRVTLPPKHIRARNSLLKKVLAATEFGLIAAGGEPAKIKDSDVEWVQGEDKFEAPDGKTLAFERWIDTDTVLDDTEKNLVRWAKQQRVATVGEVPMLATDAELDAFKTLTGFGLDE